MGYLHAGTPLVCIITGANKSASRNLRDIGNSGKKQWHYKLECFPLEYFFQREKSSTKNNVFDWSRKNNSQNRNIKLKKLWVSA